MRVSATLAWRYLRGRPGRTVLTTLAITLGVALIFGLNGMMPGLADVFTKTLFAAAGQVDLTVSGSSGGTFDASAADQVAHVPGIAVASPSVRRSVGMPNGTAVSVITLVGVDPRTAQKVRSFGLASGRMLNDGDYGQVVIGTDTATKLGLHVGSALKIPTVSGTEPFSVVGLLASGSSPSAPEVYVTLAEAQRMTGVGNTISTVEARLDPGADRAAVEAAVRRKLGSDYVVGGLSNESSLLASVQTANYMFTFFGVFALIMGGFIILNTFGTLVAERRHDIGMLRAIGASRNTILGVFLIQSVMQGVLGTVVGIVSGYLLTLAALQFYNPILRDIMHINADVSPSYSAGTWVSAIVLGIGVTVAAAVIPARRAASITPLEALRPQAAQVEERRRSAWVVVGWVVLGTSGLMLASRQLALVSLGAAGALVGLVLVAPVLIKPLASALSSLVRPFAPATAELASSNVTRQPGRAAATAAAILVSLALVVAILGVVTSLYTGFFDYIDKSLGSDFVFIPNGLILGGANVGADSSFVQRIADTPGVGDVATLRLGQAQIGAGQVQVVGIDPVVYPRVASFTFSKGTSDADVAKLGSGRTMLVNGITAGQQGMTVGQRVRLQTPNGLKDYTVVGVATDYLNAKLSTVYISQENLADDFNVRSNVLVLANAKPGAGKPAVKAALGRLAADYPQFVLYDSAGFKATQSAIFSQTFIVFDILIGMFALPTLLALLNTLAISVLARTREIGMLRAVGTTRGQIRGMVVAEAMLLAAVGVAFGIAGGIALGYALVYVLDSTMFVMPYYFPWGGITTAVVSGFGFALLASIIPARTAARLDIVSALHYE
ncbi:MAG: FtsX-like permease family protein [Coriobacteriia bacterium]|nr:FtsX-like permease family protein [Coriobacteriia bacterium]